MARSERIERRTLRSLDRLYPAAVSPVMTRHAETLRQIEALSQAGHVARARVLLRRSGLVEELARAIASAGGQAATLIRQEMDAVKEAAADG